MTDYSPSMPPLKGANTKAPRGRVKPRGNFSAAGRGFLVGGQPITAQRRTDGVR